MNEHVISAESGSLPSLTAPRDARGLVRLIQCSQCSLPFRKPVTLPCGHSMCQACVPRPYQRAHISYPGTPERRQGIACPVKACGREHPVGDVNIDRTLAEVTDSIIMEVETAQSLTEDTPSSSQESWKEGSEKDPITPRLSTLHGDRLLSTFLLASRGYLKYSAEAGYQTTSETADEYTHLDNRLLGCIIQTAINTVDCHVCLSLMFDPVTTPCGHTFCRKCLTRSLDHSRYCPFCRRKLDIPPSLDRQSSNLRLVSLLMSFWPELYSDRATAVGEEERGTVGELDTPLFVCTLGFPSMPTFLHIFEPRYRLMIRRALEGSGQFGMMMYNRLNEPQGELGDTAFMQYGTMLQIQNVQMLPDGRSLIETRGSFRFRVKRHGQLDGYTVGKIERIEDVSLSEEERIEAEETTARPPPSAPPDSPIDAQPPTFDLRPPIETMPTQELFSAAMEYVSKNRQTSAPWLRQRMLDAYGEPPTDPAIFPFWFAAILPISDNEKYHLLETTSVRQRLKIVVAWIRRIEDQNL
ncbi:hypothetical protein K402DRAFT_331032 [Aulographum hederae CBS 113979]|uniref:ATP-dependent protease-like protein n=1 Tax=Aulographum hederae CBS 113979 TaxID=1176131 RepID=A0A6G1H2I2_9PEZI|nr:hypothetical protein K402DRAFT_331032 [Aulographum hederae CBS 113979]